MFCTIANTVAIAKNRITCGPPTRSIDRLAPKPMVVKNASISGLCSVVSNWNRLTPCPRATVTITATSKPPSTGAGRLYA